MGTASMAKMFLLGVLLWYVARGTNKLAGRPRFRWR